MKGVCRKCGSIDRDIIWLRIPADEDRLAHQSAWCGVCLECKLEENRQALALAAAKIAVLRREANA